LQESWACAVRLGAAKPSEFTQVVVDTTVQEKNIAHPTDAKLAYRARERLVKLARQHGLKLRQSYVRVGKKALIKCQRYAHAKQFRRANRELRKLRTWLGRVIRDIERQIAKDAALQDIFRRELWQAERGPLSTRFSKAIWHEGALRPSVRSYRAAPRGCFSPF